MYHYTSIESIKNILLSKKIRFTRLDLLNDPYEGNFLLDNSTEPQDEYRKFLFCSCWNADESESIGLWYVYTQMIGCRIKLKSAMFSKELKLKEQESGYFPVGSIEPISIDGYRDDAHVMHQMVIKSIAGPLKINYEPSFEKTYSVAVGKSKVNLGEPNEFIMCDIDLCELGTKKIEHWSYENEWRFIVSPLCAIHFSESMMKTHIPICTPKYIDIPLQEEIEEILLAPKVTNDEFDLLTTFVKENKFTVPIKKSQIRIT